MKVIEHLKEKREGGGQDDDVRSMEEIVDSTFYLSHLHFVGYCPGKNADGKLPILDLKCWV